jgi:hypothetical protein
MTIDILAIYIESTIIRETMKAKTALKGQAAGRIDIFAQRARGIYIFADVVHGNGILGLGVRTLWTAKCCCVLVYRVIVQFRNELESPVYIAEANRTPYVLPLAGR